MTAAAPYIAHVFLSLAALTALWRVAAVLTARDAWDPINRRFLFGLRVVMAIFAGRALMVLTGIDAFRILVLVGAAFVPLAVLILAEGLRRRHAPRWLKLFIATGTVVFAVTGLWFGTGIDHIRLWALLAFQLAGLLAAGWLILGRDRASLSAAENTAAERLALSLFGLLALLPLDYVMDLIGLPVQVSGLAVLVLCWLALSLGETAMGHRESLRNITVILVAGGLATAAGGLIAGLGLRGTVVLGAVILGAMLAAAVVIASIGLQTRARSLSLLPVLDRGSADGAALAAHPVIAGAVEVSADELPDIPPETLAALFEAHPVLRASEPPERTEQAEIARYLHDRFGASHVLCLSRDPLRLMALTLPSLAATAEAELELATFARMARLENRG